MGDRYVKLFAVGEEASYRAEKVLLMRVLGQRRYFVSGEGVVLTKQLFAKDWQHKYPLLGRTTRAGPAEQDAISRGSCLKALADDFVAAATGYGAFSSTLTLAQRVSPSPNPTVAYPTEDCMRPTTGNAYQYDTEIGKKWRETI